MKVLKPCPFCGGEAELERAGDRRQSTIYACLHCSCRLETPEEWGYGTDWNIRAPDARIAELEARAEKAEADARDAKAEASSLRMRRDAFALGEREQRGRAERAEALLDGFPLQLGKEILRGDIAETRLAEAEAELARLRAAGTFNEGIEAGVVAGWNACRRSVYAVCEDIGTEADRNRSDTGNPPRHHFGRGEGDAAKRIARAFNSMEARDDDNTTEALRSLRREGGS